MDAPAVAPNADQVAYWGGPTGAKWASLQAEIDAVFAPLTRELLRAAAPAPDERVLDVGCGCGAVGLAMAERVGTGGAVTGLDLSADMLEVARHRAAAAGLSHLRFVQADASAHGGEPGGVDLIVSRLGVMFFDDPAGAFAHLRTALRPGGRIAFVCWQAMAENPWFAVPVEAVAALVEAPPPSDPFAPGPFAFADADRVRAILTTAGFSAIAIVPHRLPLPLAPAGGIAQAAAFLSQVGAAARLLKEVAPAVAAQGTAAIATAVAPYDSPDGVRMTGAVWVVTARA